MKRVLLIMMALVAICLTGCGKPADMPSDAYDLGIKALDATDKYLSGESSQSATYAILEDVYERLDGLYESGTLESAETLLLSIEISALKFKIQIDGNVKTERDNLAKRLNK